MKITWKIINKSELPPFNKLQITSVKRKNNCLIERLKMCSFNTQIYYGENKLHFDEMIMMSALY
jgi:hypothetical protein